MLQVLALPASPAMWLPRALKLPQVSWPLSLESTNTKHLGWPDFHNHARLSYRDWFARSLGGKPSPASAHPPLDLLTLGGPQRPVHLAAPEATFSLLDLLANHHPVEQLQPMADNSQGTCMPAPSAFK